MHAAKLNVPKMKYVFQAMVARPGGTAHASAVLNIQLVAVASDTALPRVFKEYWMKVGDERKIRARYGAYNFCRICPRHGTHRDRKTAATNTISDSSLRRKETRLIHLQTKRYEQTMIALVAEV